MPDSPHSQYFAYRLRPNFNPEDPDPLCQSNGLARAAHIQDSSACQHIALYTLPVSRCRPEGLLYYSSLQEEAAVLNACLLSLLI